MEYAAHIRASDEKIQSVAEHCSETAGITQKNVAKLELYNLAKLQGLIHDAGKLTADFNSYIRDESTLECYPLSTVDKLTKI